ncbi:hypothetical protein M3Y99_01613200 [Aphelenchoides fujianensis]|nr:hypothetical protein M3Y99_01613200 [Aphelenchoides fujianensis]
MNAGKEWCLCGLSIHIVALILSCLIVAGKTVGLFVGYVFLHLGAWAPSTDTVMKLVGIYAFCIAPDVLLFIGVVRRRGWMYFPAIFVQFLAAVGALVVAILYTNLYVVLGAVFFAYAFTVFVRSYEHTCRQNVESRFYQKARADAELGTGVANPMFANDGEAKH